MNQNKPMTMNDRVERYARTMPREHAVKMAMRDADEENRARGRTNDFSQRVTALTASGMARADAINAVHRELTGGSTGNGEGQFLLSDRERPQPNDEVEIQLRADRYMRELGTGIPEYDPRTGTMKARPFTMETARAWALRDWKKDQVAGVAALDQETRRMRDEESEQRLRIYGGMVTELMKNNPSLTREAAAAKARSMMAAQNQPLLMADGYQRDNSPSELARKGDTKPTPVSPEGFAKQYVDGRGQASLTELEEQMIMNGVPADKIKDRIQAIKARRILARGQLGPLQG